MEAPRKDPVWCRIPYGKAGYGAVTSGKRPEPCSEAKLHQVDGLPWLVKDMITSWHGGGFRLLWESSGINKWNLVGAWGVVPCTFLEVGPSICFAQETRAKGPELHAFF